MIQFMNSSIKLFTSTKINRMTTFEHYITFIQVLRKI